MRKSGLEKSGMEALRRVTMEPMRFSDADVSLPDMPANLKTALEERFDTLFAMSLSGKQIGYALYDTGKTAFIQPYILMRFRGRGYGKSALAACETRAREAGAMRFLSAYRLCDGVAATFAEKNGYARDFTSAFLTYEGENTFCDSACIRAYADADYGAAHELYARAFHEMRVRVGDFPNSVVEPPSERMRAFWAKTSGERLVYEENGVVLGYAHVEGSGISSVAVLPEAQGRGVGRRFVSGLCSRILASGHRRVTLSCVVGNRARKLYDALGFVERSVEVYMKKDAAGER